MDDSIIALARELTEHGVERLSTREKRVLAHIASRRLIVRDPQLDVAASMTVVFEGDRLPARSASSPSLRKRSMVRRTVWDLVDLVLPHKNRSFLARQRWIVLPESSYQKLPHGGCAQGTKG